MVADIVLLSDPDTNPYPSLSMFMYTFPPETRALRSSQQQLIEAYL